MKKKATKLKKYNCVENDPLELLAKKFLEMIEDSMVQNNLSKADRNRVEFTIISLLGKKHNLN